MSPLSGQLLSGLLMLSQMQDLIFEVTGRYGMVLGDLIPGFSSVQFLAMGLFLFVFLSVF